MGKKGKRLKDRRRKQQAARVANEKKNTITLGSAHLGQMYKAPQWGFVGRYSHKSK